MNRIILGFVFLIIVNFNSVLAEDFNNDYFNARAIRSAILHSYYQGYEDLIGVLGALDTDESRKVLVELIDYNFGESPEDVLHDVLVKQGEKIVPLIKLKMSKGVECQKQVKLYDKVKILKCKTIKNRNLFIKQILKEIKEGK